MAADIQLGGSVGPKTTTGNSFDANSRPAINFPNPTNPQDVATKDYVDTHSSAAPTGSGFPHVTSGAYDPAARAVDVSTADITGTLAIGHGGTGLTAAGANNTLIGSNGSAFINVTITAAGDVTGTTASGTITTVVAKVNGATVPAAGALTTGNAAYVSGVSALTYSALNLAGGSGWITGTLPVGNGGTGLTAVGSSGQVIKSTGSANTYVSFGGDATGAPDALTVTAITGTGSSDDFGGSGATGTIKSQEVVWQVDANDRCVSYIGKFSTTTNTDWAGIQYTPPADTTGDVMVSIVGEDVSGTSGAPTGDCYRFDLKFMSNRISTGTPTLMPTAAAILPINTNGQNAVNGGTPSGRVQLSGSAIQVQALGPVASKAWQWTITIDIQRTYKT